MRFDRKRTLTNELYCYLYIWFYDETSHERNKISCPRIIDPTDQLDLLFLAGAFLCDLHRLEKLEKINDHVRPIELTLARTQKECLQKAIGEATLRLDSVRVIWKTPESI